MKIFKDDDIGYEMWIESHQDGYVLNTETTRGGTTVKLHRADCGTIVPRGNLRSTHDYIKVCSTDKSEIKGWARTERDKELEWCGTCKKKECQNA